MECYVFTDHRDFYAFRRVEKLLYHVFPVGHINVRYRKSEFFERDLVEAFVFQKERYLIDGGSCFVLDDSVRINVAEESEFFFHFVGDLFFRTTYDDVGVDTDAAQFFYAVLGRFRFGLTCCRDVRNERYVNVEAVVFADFFFDLTDRFEEREAFDIADRTADLCDNDVNVFADAIYFFFDRIRDMRNDLYRTTEIVTAAFFADNGPVDLACRYVRVFGKVDINETFIVAEVEVSFCAVVRYEYFTVLIRAHRTRVDIDVRVEFLNRYFESAIFEQSAERCGRDAFTKRRNNTACYKYEFCHGNNSSCFLSLCIDRYVLFPCFAYAKSFTFILL